MFEGMSPELHLYFYSGDTANKYGNDECGFINFEKTLVIYLGKIFYPYYLDLF